MPLAQALVDDGDQWRRLPEDVAEAAGQGPIREPEQAPAGRIDDADLAVEIDDDETGGEARDDLPAQPLGGFRPRRHRTLLRLELR